MKILSNFELPLWLNCSEIDINQSGYFHKIWVEYYCLGESETSETCCAKFNQMCQSPYQVQNLKILLTLWDHKNPHRQNFCNLIFFIDRIRKKIKLDLHHRHT